jgi:hypothetical protein
MYNPQNSSTPPSTVDWLARYQPWRRWVEPGFWILFICLQATVNTLVVWIDVGRARLDFAFWQPLVWEWSSHLAILALIPAVVAFHRRFPLELGMFKAHLKWHLLATVPFSLVHVGAMVALRKAVYAMQGHEYRFGNVPQEVFYEFLKDYRTYFSIILVLACYRLVLLRLQGEAALLSAPDEGQPIEPVERPERFLVKKLGKEYLLPAAEVEWLEAWGNYVNLRVRGKDHPLRSTMAEIETRLDSTRFVRVHRSHIVNLDYLIEIDPQESGDAKARMKDGTNIPVSRRYRENLRKFAG